MKQELNIAYSLDHQPLIDCYLPSAYFVETNKTGQLGYMVARAVPQNWSSYGVEIEETPHESLLAICQLLTSDALTQKYAGKRKKASLKDLVSDAGTKGLILQYVQRKMKEFLQQVGLAKYPLCLCIERKTYLEQIRIKWHEQVIYPNLSFIKMAEGIEYKLELSQGEKVIIPQNHDVQIILDDPGYIVIDYQLSQLELINGNKIKPFIQKSSVFIPERMTKTYFEKFILDVVNKVDIHSEGFEVELINEIQKVSINFTEDFIDDRFVLDLDINYGETSFNASDQNRRRNRLILDQDDHVCIKQIVRSEEEEKFVDILQKMGLQRNQARRFFLPDGAGKFDLIHWVIEHRYELQKCKIEITPPILLGSPVLIEKPDIKLEIVDENDWFDITGIIQLGEVKLHFTDLLYAIKNEEPLFKLPNGQIFIIPESWMTKYRALADFGIKKGDSLQIKRSQYTVVEDTEEFSAEMRQVVNLDEEVEYLPDPDLKADLRPYQIEGVKWLINHQQNGLGACLADDMGLGKTLQTLAVLSYTKNRTASAQGTPEIEGQLTLFDQSEPTMGGNLMALIIVPASLIFNWEEEIIKFCPKFSFYSLVGSTRHTQKDLLDQFDVVLTTYQTALRDISDLGKFSWQYIILDESHMIKNRESKIFKAVNQLNTVHKISLSGTPIENSLADLWSQMQFINPDILGTFSFFKKHFVLPIQQQQDEGALQQLRLMVEPFILRRRKQDVAKDLPEISSQIEYVPMTPAQEKMFEEEKSAARNYLLAISEETPDFTFHVLSSLLRLRQIANHPKLLDELSEVDSGKFNHVQEQINSVLASGHKVLIFSSFTSHLDLFSKVFDEDGRPYCLLTGKTSQKKRKEQVHLFQEDAKNQVFLISIKAGGTGLNLTRADYVFILDPWWNPFVEEQAIARAHRIGREQPISVIRFISKNSIEEKIILLQARKKILAAELIEGSEQVKLAKEDLRFLLE